MTIQEIAATFQAASGTCRFCGRSDKHCTWMDPRQTICNHPECVERMHLSGDSAFHRIHSQRCACGGYKSRKRAFCLGCWVALPETLAKMLFEPVERGFGCYVAEAVAYLRSHGKAAS